MKKTRRNSCYNKNRRRRRHKTIRKKFEGGSQKQETPPPTDTMLSVIGDNAKAVLNKVVKKAFNVLGYEKKDDASLSLPPSTEQEQEQEEPNKIVEAASNAAVNLKAASNAIFEKINDPNFVEAAKETTNNIGEIAGPIFDKTVDKAVETVQKQSGKVGVAIADMGTSALGAIPGVGAVIALGREANDIQTIVSASLDSTKEVLNTLNEGIVEGADKYEEIKNLQHSLPNVPTLPSLPNVPSLPNNNDLPSIRGGGERGFKKLQKAGATINNRINDSINEFLKNKTHKNKKVRFNI